MKDNKRRMRRMAKSEKAILELLQEVAKENDVCEKETTYARLAREMSRPYSTVRNAILRMEKKGFVQITRSFYEANDGVNHYRPMTKCWRTGREA